MHIEKMKQSNNYIYTHCDRSYSGVYNGTSNIDPSRTILNFNCAENNRHREEQLEYIKSQTGKKLRRDAVAVFAPILTLPRDYFPRMHQDMDLLHRFFRDAYESIRDYFNLKDSDVASAWVHMDEDSPHMHFLGTPLVRDEKGCHLNFDLCVPRKKYQEYHYKIEEMMRQRGWSDLNLLNGATRDGNLTVNQLKAKTLAEKNKLLEDEIASKEDEVSEIKSEIANLAGYASRAKKKIKNLTVSDKVLTFCDRYKAEIIQALLLMMDDPHIPEQMKIDFTNMMAEMERIKAAEDPTILTEYSDKSGKDKEEEKNDRDKERGDEQKEHISETQRGL